MLQLVVVEVGGSQGHHEVAEPNERTVGVCEETDNHVTIEDSHGRLVAILQEQDQLLTDSWRLYSLPGYSPL